MSATKWTQFFWSDWESDESLKVSSLAAQGLWMRLLCVAAKSNQTGYVTVNSRPLAVTDIARLAGVTESECEALISELDRNGVFSRNSKGTIFCRRMVREEKNRENARKNGKMGGNPTLCKQRKKTQGVNPPLNPGLNGGVLYHIPITIEEREERKELLSEVPKERTLKPKTEPRGSRLPADFVPDETVHRIVNELNLTPDEFQFELAKFGDYWRGTAGAKGRKLDWQGTLRNWLRNSATTRRKPNFNGQKQTFSFETMTDDRWKSVLRISRQNAMWDSAKYGPRPGEPGCRVPQQLLEATDGKGWIEWDVRIIQQRQTATLPLSSP